MDPQELEQLFAALSAIPSDRRNQIDGFLEKLQQEVKQVSATEPKRPSADSLGQGAPLEIGFDVDVQLTPARQETFLQMLKAKPDLLPMAIPLAQLPENLFELLQQIEAPLLIWMGEPKNAAFFAMNPTLAIEKMASDTGITLNPHLLEVLNAVRKVQSSRQPITPGVRLDKVKVKVNPENKF